MPEALILLGFGLIEKTENRKSAARPVAKLRFPHWDHRQDASSIGGSPGPAGVAASRETGVPRNCKALISTGAYGRRRPSGAGAKLPGF